MNIAYLGCIPLKDIMNLVFLSYHVLLPNVSIHVDVHVKYRPSVHVHARVC